MKYTFYFILKALFSLKKSKLYLNFLLMQKKQSDQIDKLDFKIYEVTTWFKNNYSTHCPISYGVKATRQLILVSYQNITREIFFLKNFVENEARRLVQDLFLFSKENLYKVKASGFQLTFNILRQSSTLNTIATNSIKLTKFHYLTAFTSGDIFNTCTAIVCSPRCDIINFCHFSTGPKNQEKYLNIFRTRRAFEVK